MGSLESDRVELGWVELAWDGLGSVELSRVGSNKVRSVQVMLGLDWAGFLKLYEMSIERIVTGRNVHRTECRRTFCHGCYHKIFKYIRMHSDYLQFMK